MPLLTSYVMQNPRFLSEDENENSLPRTEMAVGLETGNGLEDELFGSVSVLSTIFLFIFHHWFRSWYLRKRFPKEHTEDCKEGQSLEVECCLQKTKTQRSLNGTESSQKEVLCGEWTGLGQAQSPEVERCLQKTQTQWSLNGTESSQKEVLCGEWTGLGQAQSPEVEHCLQKTQTQWSLNGSESSQKEVLCGEWRGLGQAQSPVRHHRKAERLVVPCHLLKPNWKPSVCIEYCI